MLLTIFEQYGFQLGLNEDYFIFLFFLRDVFYFPFLCVMSVLYCQYPVFVSFFNFLFCDVSVLPLFSDVAYCPLFSVSGFFFLFSFCQCIFFLSVYCYNAAALSIFVYNRTCLYIYGCGLRFSLH